MRERSTLVALALACAGGCSSKPAAKLPEADPARVATLATTMLRNVPVPAGAPECKFDQLLGGATLTRRTLIELAEQEMIKRPEVAEWVNPTEVDSPAARTIIESKDVTLRRQAAAQLLSAPFYLVYHVDLVDTPIPLGVKDFKRGNVGARALRYDTSGNVSCVMVFFWGNDPAKTEWAMKKSDKALIDPEVQKEMQQDLRRQMLKRVAALAAPAPKTNLPADDRHDRL